VASLLAGLFYYFCAFKPTSFASRRFSAPSTTAATNAPTLSFVSETSPSFLNSKDKPPTYSDLFKVARGQKVQPAVGAPGADSLAGGKGEGVAGGGFKKTLASPSPPPYQISVLTEIA